MKFTFHVSPNIKDRFSTQRIMWELTGGLMVIFVISCIYYGTSYGMNYAMQAIILLASSLITTLVCEAILRYVQRKTIGLYQDIFWLGNIYYLDDDGSNFNDTICIDHRNSLLYRTW